MTDVVLEATTPTRLDYPLTPDLADRPRALIYCRQSKRRSDDSQASPEMQRTAAEAFCISQGYNPVACFTDVGKSGWNPKVVRPAYEEMMRWVRDGKADVVVIYTLSRLTRQGAHEALNIEKEMRDHGVTLSSVREPYLDTSSPVGIGIFAIMAGLAKQESDLKSDYVADARELARLAGGHLSGPAPFGLRSTPAKTESGVKFVKLVPEVEPDENGRSEADVVRDMAALALDGRSPARIAEHLNTTGVPSPSHRAKHLGRKFGGGAGKTAQLDRPMWTATQVYRVLFDPRIAGMAAEKSGSYTYAVRRDEDGIALAPHDPIVTPGEWYLIQAKLNPEKKVTREARKGHTWLMTGWNFLRCYCGIGMTCSGETNRVRAYRCSRNNEYRKMHNHAGTSVVAGATDDFVAERVFARMVALDVENEEDADLLAEVAKRFLALTDTSGTARELAAVRAQLEHTNNSVDELYDDKDVHKLYEGPRGKAAFKRQLDALTGTQAECRRLIAELEAGMNRAVAIPVEEWYGDVMGDPIGKGSPWSTWDIMKKREFLSLWLDFVEVVPPKVARTTVPIGERLVFHWATPREEVEGEL